MGEHFVRTSYDEPFKILIEGDYSSMRESKKHRDVYIFKFEDNKIILMIFHFEQYKDAFIIHTDSRLPKLKIPCTNIHGEIYLFVERSNVKKLQHYIKEIKELNNGSIELDKQFYIYLDMLVQRRRLQPYPIIKMMEDYRSRMFWKNQSKRS